MDEWYQLSYCMIIKNRKKKKKSKTWKRNNFTKLLPVYYSLIFFYFEGAVEVSELGFVKHCEDIVKTLVTVKTSCDVSVMDITCKAASASRC